MCYDTNSLILFLIVILLYIHLLKLKSSFTLLSKLNKSRYELTDNDNVRAMNILSTIHDKFTKNNIFYVIENNLLLKVLRREKLIYDSDLQNIFVWRKDKNNIMTVLKEYSLSDKSTHLELKINNNLSINLNMYIEPSADNNDNRVLRCGSDSCSSYRDYNFKMNELEPRRIYNYFNIELWGPSETREYIKELFGTNALNKYTYNDVDENYYNYRVPEVYNLYNKLYDER